MSADFELRDTYTLMIDELRFDESEFEITDVDRLKLLIPNRKNPIDIGCLAYSKRKRTELREGQLRYTEVSTNPVSYDSSRIKAITDFLENIFFLKSKGLSYYSIWTKIRTMLVFCDWCDDRGIKDFLNDINGCIDALNQYSIYLEHRLRLSEIKQNPAANEQTEIANLLADIHSITRHEILSGIRKIRLNQESTSATAPPDETDLTIVLKHYTLLFDGFHDLIFNEKKFPYRLKLPYESVWLFPAPKKFATKKQLENRETWSAGLWVYDYENGEIITDPTKIEHRYKNHNYPKGVRHLAKNAIENAIKVMHDNNHNMYSTSRIKILSLAVGCFLVLFYANTGINSEQIINLKFSAEYELSKESHGFRSIKNRAGGKEVEFLISRSFVPYFKKYIELRKKFPALNDFEYLFFSYNYKDKKFQKISLKTIGSVHKNIVNMLGYDIPFINARQWRAYKSDFSLRKTDPTTTAMLLQNTEQTVLKSYSKGSEADASVEFTDFFLDIDKKIAKEDVILTDSPIGGCREANSPLAEESAIIEPNCTNFEGCLFCKNFALHADEIDVSKILSFLYVVNETKHLAHNETQFNDIFGEVISRAKAIISKIENQSSATKEMVAKVKRQVDNEDLHPYWQKKLDMLTEIGIA